MEDNRSIIKEGIKQTTRFTSKNAIVGPEGRNKRILFGILKKKRKFIITVINSEEVLANAVQGEKIQEMQVSKKQFFV